MGFSDRKKVLAQETGAGETSLETGVSSPIEKNTNEKIKFEKLIQAYESSKDLSKKARIPLLRELQKTLKTEEDGERVQEILRNIVGAPNEATLKKYFAELDILKQEKESVQTQVIDRAKQGEAEVKVEISQTPAKEIPATPVGKTIEDAAETEKLGWLEKRMSDRIGEGWEEIKKTWDIETTEDYGSLEKIFDLVGDAMTLLILDIGVSLLEKLLTEGGSFTIGNLYNALSFLLKKDASMLYGLYEEGDYGILFLFLYVQANAGFVGYRYARDYLTTNYGDKASKIGDESGRIKKWIKKTLGSNYLDAVDGRTNIFELGETQGVSEKQNEYLKRKKTIDILKSVYFDDPKSYNKLQNIETRFMQANSKTFWREIYMLLQKRGIIRKIVSGSLKPELLKSELEAQVIAARNKLQKAHFETIGMLYSTTEVGESITIEKDKESKFLKGLRAEIENNPELTTKERESRIAILERYLNQVTSNKVLKKESVLEELIRIRDGYATKLEMLTKLEEEIKAGHEGGLLKSKIQNTLDVILLRKRNLRGFQSRISTGKWNGTFKEFEKMVETIKQSKILVSFGSAKKMDFGNLDTFVKETEIRSGDFAKKTELYGKDSLGNLRNWISYIVPDNSVEKSMKDTLKKFEENKTPYSETQFFRELERVKRGFLPSNIVLSRLEHIKDRIIIPETTEKENGITKKIKSLQFSIEKTSSEKTRYAYLGGIRDFVNDASIYFYNGDYSAATKALQEAVGISRGNIKHLLFNIISDIKSLLSFQISRKDILPDTKVSLSQADTKKLEVIQQYIADARTGSIDLSAKDIEAIEKGVLEYDATKKSPDFFDNDGKILKKDLETFKNLNQDDYLKSIQVTEDAPGIQKLEASVLDSLKSERNLFKIKREIGKIEGDIFDIDIELRLFADSIFHHSYTRGQANGIITQIFSGKKFGDAGVEDIIKNTSKHSQTLEILTGLKDSVEQKFETLSKEEKAKIVDFMSKHGMESEKNLPPNIKRELKSFETLGDTEKLIKTQQAELQRIIGDLETARTEEEIKKIRKEFNDYIKDQKIDRTSEKFKSLITTFENNFSTKPGNTIVVPPVTEETKITAPERETKSSAPIETLETIQERLRGYLDRIAFSLDRIAFSIYTSGDSKVIDGFESVWKETNNSTSSLFKEMSQTENPHRYLKNLFKDNFKFDIFATDMSIDEVKLHLLTNTKIRKADIKFSEVSNFTDLGKYVASLKNTDLRANIATSFNNLKLAR